jgi:hypothetical protein
MIQKPWWIGVRLLAPGWEKELDAYDCHIGNVEKEIKRGTETIIKVSGCPHLVNAMWVTVL